MIPILVVCAYLLFQLTGSFKKKKGSETADSYLLAGRKLTLIPFVATTVTSAYGWILGIGELYYDFGISAWLFLSLPYTSFSLVMAFFFARRIQEQEIRSIPELLAKHYGKHVARFAALFVLLYISPAMYILMTGQILANVFPFPMWVCLLMALFFSSVYLYLGGFRMQAKKDQQKFVFMFGGFLVVLLYLCFTRGTEVLQAIPSGKKEFTFGAHIGEIVTWFLLATMVFADPGYHQRIYSGKNTGVARKGLILSVICWTIFDFLAVGIAFYGLALIPGLENASDVYLLLGEFWLNPVLRSVFLLGLLATVMSTADSYLFLSAQTFVIDLLGKREDTGRSMRMGLFIVSIFTFLLLIPYQDKTVVDLFYDLNPFIASVLVVPVVCAFFSLRFSPLQVFVQMFLSLAACSLWLWLDETWTSGSSPVLVGVPVSFLTAVVFLLFNKRKSGYSKLV